MTVMNTRNLASQLGKHGFTPAGDGYRHNDFGRGGMTATFERRWVTLQTGARQNGSADNTSTDTSTDNHSTDSTDMNSTDIGRPGLWKTVRDAAGGRREFHLPQELISAEAWDDATGDLLDPLTELIHWGRVSAAGELPDGWECPAQEELKRSLPQGAFTVEAGSCARQGQLLCETQRLAIQFPLLQAVPADLSDARRAWLEVILADGQNRCRLVRLAPDTTETTRILAEVDLSGVPRFAAAPLVRIGLDAVRHVLSQMMQVCDLLVDPTVTSTVWDFPPVQVEPAEGDALWQLDKNRP